MMGTKNPPQISKHLQQIEEDKTIRICRQWQVGLRGGGGKNFQLMAIAGRAALNMEQVFYTELNTFDLLIGQGTTACTLLIRNGKCLELKSQYDSIFSS